LWALAIPVYAHSMATACDPVEVSVVGPPPQLVGPEADVALERSRH
jgi:hypothetical protein